MVFPFSGKCDADISGQCNWAWKCPGRAGSGAKYSADTCTGGECAWESWNTERHLKKQNLQIKIMQITLFNSNGELENGRSNGMESGGVQNPHFYKAGAFNASNLSCLFFTAAVRVGYAPEIIWKEMRDMILNRGIPNGFLKENPHGIEQLKHPRMPSRR